MRSKVALALAAATMTVTGVTIPTAADARHHDTVYRGRDGHYYRHCHRSSGTTGAIAGGAGGALIGHAIGGGVLGTVAGGVGGALLGRHLDRRHDAAQNRRNGC